MRDLSAHREDRDFFEEEETRLLRAMTVSESVHEWLALQEAFESQLRETDEIFGPERRIAMVELQARLSRLRV